MAYRMQLSIGSGSVNPWAAAMPTAAMPAAGACSTAYGPVANICQSSVPVTQQVPVTTMVPVTSVTPIANTVAPQTVVGQPMGAAPYGKGAMSPWSKTAPLGFAPGISTMGKTTSPWGVSTQGTTGFAPGLYTQEVSIPW